MNEPWGAQSVALYLGHEGDLYEGFIIVARRFCEVLEYPDELLLPRFRQGHECGVLLEVIHRERDHKRRRVLVVVS